MTNPSDATPFGMVLMIMPESEVLTGDVKVRIDGLWGDLPASNFAEQSVYLLASELLAVLPDNEGYGNELRLKVAEEIKELLTRLGFSQSASSRTPAQPVAVQRNYSEMSLRQLLEAVNGNPEAYAEASHYISTHPELAAAYAKTYEWVIPAANGEGIDIEATLAYVIELKKKYSVVQAHFRRRRPVSLDRAMGIDDRPLIHPFTGQLVQGPDENEFDWRQLDGELHEALIWARKSGHRAWPQSIDVYDDTEEVFDFPNLKRRWQTILDDYRHAKATGRSTTLGITRVWPEDLSHNEIYTFGIVVTKNYETLVREAARMRAPLSHSGSGANLSGGVYSSIKISGSGVNGTIYAPPGVGIKISGSGGNVQIKNVSWQQLAEMLDLI